MLTAFIEATETEAHAALTNIERALCADPDHDGCCPVPWTTMIVQFSEMDLEERRSWQESFDEERRRAREAGTRGA